MERVWSVERYDAAAAEVEVTPTSRLLALPGGLLPAAGQAAAVPNARRQGARSCPLQSVLLRCSWPLQSWASRCAALQPLFCLRVSALSRTLLPALRPSQLTSFLSLHSLHPRSRTLVGDLQACRLVEQTNTEGNARGCDTQCFAASHDWSRELCVKPRESAKSCPLIDAAALRRHADGVAARRGYRIDTPLRRDCRRCR